MRTTHPRTSLIRRWPVEVAGTLVVIMGLTAGLVMCAGMDGRSSARMAVAERATLTMGNRKAEGVLLHCHRAHGCAEPAAKTAPADNRLTIPFDHPVTLRIYADEGPEVINISTEELSGSHRKLGEHRLTGGEGTGQEVLLVQDVSSLSHGVGGGRNNFGAVVCARWAAGAERCWRFRIKVLVRDGHSKTWRLPRDCETEVFVQDPDGVGRFHSGCLGDPPLTGESSTPEGRNPFPWPQHSLAERWIQPRLVTTIDRPRLRLATRCVRGKGTCTRRTND